MREMEAPESRRADVCSWRIVAGRNMTFGGEGHEALGLGGLGDAEDSETWREQVKYGWMKRTLLEEEEEDDDSVSDEGLVMVVEGDHASDGSSLTGSSKVG